MRTTEGYQVYWQNRENVCMKKSQFLDGNNKCELKSLQEYPLWFISYTI